jgi:hypothetical protein
MFTLFYELRLAIILLHLSVLLLYFLVILGSNSSSDEDLHCLFHGQPVEESPI